jgi:hypothetical protein
MKRTGRSDRAEPPGFNAWMSGYRYRDLIAPQDDSSVGDGQ